MKLRCLSISVVNNLFRNLSKSYLNYSVSKEENGDIYFEIQVILTFPSSNNCLKVMIGMKLFPG